MPRCRDAEPGEQRRGARVRGVAADFVEAMVEQRECLAGLLGVDGGGGPGRFQRALDGAQLVVAVQHEIERRRRDRGRFLRDVRDRPRRRQLDVAGVGVQLAAQERKQARLAAAVGADQAHLVPGVHGEARALEEALRAAGERQV